jgi:hypothetical protein
VDHEVEVFLNCTLRKEKKNRRCANRILLQIDMADHLKGFYHKMVFGLTVDKQFCTVLCILKYKRTELLEHLEDLKYKGSSYRISTMYALQNNPNLKAICTHRCS